MAVSGTGIELAGKISPYLRAEPRLLRDVCQTTGRDDGGRHCPQCAVRDFCRSQAARKFTSTE
jgi:hypothetical protein